MHLQRIFAGKWLAPLWPIVTFLGAAVLCLAPYVFRIEHLGDGKPACGYAGISAIAGLTGFMLGVFPGLLVPGPLFHVRA